MAETATPKWASTVINDYRTNVLKHGNIALGRSRVEAHTARVQIEGAAATVEVCVDHTSTFVVPAGTNTVGVGATSGPRIIETFTLQLDGDAWLINHIGSKARSC